MCSPQLSCTLLSISLPGAAWGLPVVAAPCRPLSLRADAAVLCGNTLDLMHQDRSEVRLRSCSRRHTTAAAFVEAQTALMPHICVKRGSHGHSHGHIASCQARWLQRAALVQQWYLLKRRVVDDPGDPVGGVGCCGAALRCLEVPRLQAQSARDPCRAGRTASALTQRLADSSLANPCREPLRALSPCHQPGKRQELSTALRDW